MCAINSGDDKGHRRHRQAAAYQIPRRVLESDRFMPEQGGNVGLLVVAKAEISWLSMAMTCARAMAG